MIRSVAPSDLWSLRFKPRQQIILCNEQLFVQPHQPLWFALFCLLRGNKRDHAMVVFQARGRRAFIQAQGRPGRPEQEIIYLAGQGEINQGCESNPDLWFRLLERWCLKAAQFDIQRFYAPLWSNQVELREIFRQLGFQAYTRRSILQLTLPQRQPGLPLAPMRPQRLSDAWAIQKLYSLLTPQLVQGAEGRTSLTWVLPPNQGWQTSQRQAWVLGPEDNLTAYLHLLSGPVAHVLTLLIHPEMRDQTAAVIRFGLAQLPDFRVVYLLLRDYQAELVIPAQNLGFQTFGEQTLLTKTGAIPMRHSLFRNAFDLSKEIQVSIPSIATSREDS